MRGAINRKNGVKRRMDAIDIATIALRDAPLRLKSRVP